MFFFNPYVFFHDDQRKTTVLPPMFYLINIDSFTPHVSFDKNDSVTPYVLIDNCRQCYPLYLFHDGDKKRQSYPSCFFLVDQ